MGGNFYGLKPEVGRHDSSKGILLLGNEEGTYTASSLVAPVKGEVRDAQVIVNSQQQNLLLIGINNGEIEVLAY